MSMDERGSKGRRIHWQHVAGVTLLVVTGCSAMDRGPLANSPAPAEAPSIADSPNESPQPWSSHYGSTGESDEPALQPQSDIVQVSTVGLAEPLNGPTSPVRLAVQQQRGGDAFSTGADARQPLPEPDPLPADRYPLDLATALQLAGANHLQIAVAAEQVRESAARLDRAEVLWVPSINFGVGYNRHDGQIQGTEGEVIEVSRSSAFVGGGPRIGDAPLTGMGGGPRLFVGLNPAEAYFQPLAERRAVQAASAQRAVTFNDALLEVGLAYYDLTAAQMRIAIASETLQNTEQLVRLTEEFERVGAGLAADAARARAQRASARMERLEAEKEVRVNAAELARLLRLDSSVVLYPAETLPIPVTLVSTEIPLPELIAQGLGNRPELSRDQARVAEAQARLRLEQWRPLVPNIQVGNSFGGFGGGPNSFFGDFEARNDFDALAVWEVESFGLGNGARRRERSAVQRQEWLRFQQMRDRVAAEVAQAYHRAQLSAEQVEVAETLVSEAAEALPLNLRAIQGGQLSPIEAQQAIGQLANARRQYLAAVIDYDRAQLQLLRAIGNPPEPLIMAPPVAPQGGEMLPLPPEPFDVSAAESARGPLPLRTERTRISGHATAQQTPPLSS